MYGHDDGQRAYVNGRRGNRPATEGTSQEQAGADRKSLAQLGPSALRVQRQQSNNKQKRRATTKARLHHHTFVPVR